jgi:hypothetical protein
MKLSNRTNMNKLITHKITLSIFFVIACQFTVKAQDTAKRVIVVVRPGGATGVTSITSLVPAPATTGTVAPGSTPAATGTQKTPVATQKVAATPYVAPGTRSHTYMAPSTAERAGTASYMNKNIAPASKTAVVAKTPAPAVAVIAVPVAGTTPSVSGTDGGTGKFAAAAPAAPVITVTPAVAPAPAKKDTVYVTKVQKDTVPALPMKHMGNKIVFLEIGGPGLAVSINYDMRFKKGSKDGLGFRAGVGYFAAGNNTVFTVPLMVNYLYGKDGKYIEIGLGTTFLNSKGDNYSSSVWEFDDVTGFIATAVIGVRYEPNKSLNFRLGYVPILYDEGLINAGGFSIGYTF